MSFAVVFVFARHENTGEHHPNPTRRSGDLSYAVGSDFTANDVVELKSHDQGGFTVIYREGRI